MQSISHILLEKIIIEKEVLKVDSDLLDDYKWMSSIMNKDWM